MSNTLDYLQQSQDEFDAPENENSLRQHSEKLVFSVRLFPEWLVAAYGILHKKYPGTAIDSSSKLLQLIVQDYINLGFTKIGSHLPPTEDSINFLIRQGFVNADSRTQFNKLSKASDKSMRYEEQMMSSTNLRDQYIYWKDRDPEKAEAILDEMSNQAAQKLAEPPEKNDPKDYKDEINTNKDEQVDESHKQGVNLDKFIKSKEDDIVGADVPDNVPTKDES